MSLNKFIKYIFRFLFIQFTVIGFSLWYFDNYLITLPSLKEIIYQNLVDDWSRFFSFIPIEYLTVDAFLVVSVGLFVVLLFSTKFYTYVNELTFTLSKNFFDEFINIYFLWTSYMFSVFFVFRFENLSRFALIVYSILVPLILFIFRNTEVLLSILGRSPLNEKYITFNLDESSVYRNLRILNFRTELESIEIDIKNNPNEVISHIDSINKEEEINLILINLNDISKITKNLEEYLINLNKKVLLMSNQQLIFHNYFIYRTQMVSDKYFYYFNNDIQYGAKYIIKRLLDIFLSIIFLIILFPVLISISIYIILIDGRPFLIKQNRVGLHGKQFKMLKFRTMRNNSHEMREDLDELNKKSGPLFKIEDDPRLLRGAKSLRKFSIDELPQLFNVLSGNMSLVGPRPLFDTDTKLFNESYMRRLNVTPGMTGLLQINQRNTDDFETWFKYDLEYIENWSLYLDLKILAKTIPSLFNKKNRGV